MINVMIVEDQTMPRQLFELYVKSAPEYNLMFSIRDADMAEVYCLKYPINLILMDVITTGKETGLDAAEHIKSRHPEIKIIIVTSMPEYSYIERARKIGVDSFWYKETSRDPIVELMNRTMAGESIYPDRTPEILLGNASSYEFTVRELEVLRELTSGDPNSEIAGRMKISVETLKYHIKQLLEKTGFKGRTELAVKARESGLVILDRKK
jgi:DNA-binding NarL/FixJ family response regulator